MADILEDDVELNEDGSYTVPDEAAEETAETIDFGANLVHILDRQKLDALGLDLCQLIEQDIEDRDKRNEQYKEGLKRTGLAMDDQTPAGDSFEGASRVVHPMIAQGCVDFASRAIKELFPASGPVKTAITGEATVVGPVNNAPQAPGNAENNHENSPGMNSMPVPFDAKMQLAEKKRDFMNWQLVDQIKEYRTELEQLLTQLPLGGSQYLKIYYDESVRRIRVEFVPIDEFIIAYSASSFHTALRATHIQHLTEEQLVKRVQSGLYADVTTLSAPSSVPEGSAPAQQNAKIEGKEAPHTNEDGLQDIFECHCLIDIEGDGPKPYIVSLSREDNRVLAIYRNWEENDDTFQRIDWFVEWVFIPWRGANGVGLHHLIGGLSVAATGALRALLDSAHVNNFPAGIKLKGGKGTGANIQLNATGISEIDAPAGVDDIRKTIMGLPFNPPSPVLFQLLEWLTAAGKEVVATAAESLNDVGDRTPVGTTMAIVEQNSTTYASIHTRLHFSQLRSFQIIQRLNAIHMRDEDQVKALGKVIISQQDFLNTKDIAPVSDPNIFSEAQRYTQNTAIQQLAQQTPNLPWNMFEINRRTLRLMHVENIDALLPLPPQPYSNDIYFLEHTAALEGKQLATQPQQNHMFHIVGHLDFILDPVFGVESPAQPPSPGWGTILGHAQKHLVDLYQILRQQCMTEANQRLMMVQQQMMAGAQEGIPGVPMVQTGLGQQVPQIPQAMVMQEAEKLFFQRRQQLQPIINRFAQAQQSVAKKTPPPQLPPEVQAQVQIAQLEVNRKSEMDKATLALKQQEAQVSSQIDQMKLQMDMAQQQFDQRITMMQTQFEQNLAAQEIQIEAMARELTQQVEIQKNEADNRQHQLTELMKNHEDNQTNMMIEQMRQEGLQNRAEMETAFKQHQAQLDSLMELVTAMNTEKQSESGTKETSNQGNEELKGLMEKLNSLVEAINRPKTALRDAKGKLIGIQ